MDLAICGMHVVWEGHSCNSLAVVHPFHFQLVSSREVIGTSDGFILPPYSAFGRALFIRSPGLHDDRS